MQQLTPAMKQYYDLKAQYPDCILFFRMGDFYEMFEEDAKIAHSILGISLTSRNKNSENPIALAGIPYHAKQKYLPLLLSAGYKVAIAEQISDPQAKGIVEREVQRVVTPATAGLEGEEYENSGNGGILIAIDKISDMYGFSCIDISSQSWVCSEFSDFTLLSSKLYKLFPSEIILEKSLGNLDEFSEIFSRKYKTNMFYTQRNENYYSNLTQYFGVKNLESYGIENKKAAQSAAALAYNYLRENQKTDFSFFKNLKYESFSNRMNLDEATIKSLDLVYNIATNSKTQGTLFGVLQKTKTPMGKRLLHHEILHPLKNKDEIISRQDFIEIFTTHPVLLDKIREKLKYIGDMEMFLARLGAARVGVKDLLHFKKYLITIREILEIIEQSGNKKILTLLKDL